MAISGSSLISHIGSTALLILFLVLLLCIAVCAILSFVPKRPYLDRTTGTIVQPFLALSSPLRFPLARIDIKDMPEGLMENLSVINHGCLNIFGIYSAPSAAPETNPLSTSTSATADTASSTSSSTAAATLSTRGNRQPGPASRSMNRIQDSPAAELRSMINSTDVISSPRIPSLQDI